MRYSEWIEYNALDLDSISKIDKDYEGFIYRELLMRLIRNIPITQLKEVFEMGNVQTSSVSSRTLEPLNEFTFFVSIDLDIPGSAMSFEEELRKQLNKNLR